LITQETMFVLLQILTLVLLALALTASLAHALEAPGKMRLPEQDYRAVQPIYYPGFTLIGPAEPLGVIALGFVAFFWSGPNTGFWLTVAAAIGLAAAHAIYWLVTHPVNKVWLEDTDLKGAGKGFFGFAQGSLNGDDWTALRDRWEYSHVVRAACVSFAFICFTVAVIID
jgi:hypothetical protein